jgi:TolA-binding protein
MKPSLPILVACLLALIVNVAAQSLNDKGKVLYESKKYSDAKKVFELVKENTSGYPEAQYCLGKIAYDQKEYEDAVEYFETATEVNTKNGA